MTTYDQQELFVRREKTENKDVLYNEGNKENFKGHEQFIQCKFLEEIGNLPARCSVQITTTEVTHPISFRFSMPTDIEKFVLALLEAYKRIVERKTPNSGFRFLRYDWFMGEIRKVLMG